MKKSAVLTFILIIAGVLIVSVPRALTFGGCDQDCKQCHTIEQSEIKNLLTKLQAPEAEVLSVKMSPVGGLWEVLLKDKDKLGLLYVGFSKKHVVLGPAFEVGDTITNLTIESLKQSGQPLPEAPSVPKMVDYGTIPVDKAILLGSKDALHKPVVFTDPDCPYCGKLHEELKKIVASRSDIAFYLKFFPLPMHPDSLWKSKSILCSNSVEMLEQNFLKKQIPRPDCETLEPEQNVMLAKDLGITGTPTMIMPDGFVFVGGRDAAALAELILQHAKQGASQ